MPMYLTYEESYPDLDNFKSVLIVPCRFCPAASLAIHKEEPYFKFFKNFLKTDSYEKLIESIRSNLRARGIITDIFRSRLLHQFVICMWGCGRRDKLSKLASKYDAILVMGCEAAVQTVYESVKMTSCQVFQGMKSEGVMTVKPSFKLPGNISLKLNNIISLIHQNKDSLPWKIL
jgi:hypothetical protein